MESLFIKTLKGEETTKELLSVESNYQSDINVEELEVELQTLKVLLKNKDVVCADFISVMQSLLSFFFSEEKKLIKNVCVLCKLLVVNPATSATAERRVKTWMRSTMLPSRFNSLAILTFHKERTDSLDLIATANAFACSNDNRKRLFGVFI